MFVFHFVWLITTHLAVCTYLFISSQFFRSEIWALLAGFSVESQKAEIKVLAGLGSYLEAPGKNLLPSSFRYLEEFSSLKL